MEKEYIFGIDLGTTYSVISYLDENGLIQTCSNDVGNTITPSVVDLSDENPTVGQVAKDSKPFYPHSVLDFFKCEMGQGHAVKYYGEDFSKETTAIDLSSEVLKYLAKYASDETGSKVRVATVTVPAYFGLEEKQATKEAAEKAGFAEVHLIEEPTAAAVYYGYKGDKKETVLVYDLGGGTFDVVAVDIDGNNYNCFVIAGDQQLGGKNWDEAMQNIIKRKLAEKGIDEGDLDDEDIAEIQNAAEKAKKELTPKPETSIKLRLNAGKASFEVSRQEFDEETKELLDRTIVTTRSVKEKAEAEGHTITKILLVGGSSYMPQVQQRLIEEFPDVEVPNPMDPNMAVSKGAAYYGMAILPSIISGSISGEPDPEVPSEEMGGEEAEGDPGFVITAGIKETYGDFVLTAGDAPVINKVSVSSIGILGKAGDRLVIRTLLKSGDPLPTTTDQDIPLSMDAIAAGEVELTLYEHRSDAQFVDKDDKEVGLNELQKRVGEISKGLPSGSCMHIHMEIDYEGLLKMTATDPNGVVVELKATAKVN